jgi:hypothetical protein
MALGVLLVALVCLVVGLVLTSSAWLIASLVASGIAGLVLLRDRARGRAIPPSLPDSRAPLATGTADSGSGGRDTADSETADSGTTAPGTAGSETAAPGPTASGTAASGTAASGTAAASGGAGSGSAASGAAGSGALSVEVWVVDGRPRYHRETCLILKGQHAEPIPRAQAQEDGFIPCTNCEPDLDPGTGRR